MIGMINFSRHLICITNYYYNINNIYLQEE
jgi:hypothetical protein